MMNGPAIFNTYFMNELGDAGITIPSYVKISKKDVTLSAKKLRPFTNKLN